QKVRGAAIEERGHKRHKMIINQLAQKCVRRKKAQDGGWNKNGDFICCVKTAAEHRNKRPQAGRQKVTYLDIGRAKVEKGFPGPLQLPFLAGGYIGAMQPVLVEQIGTGQKPYQMADDYEDNKQ